MLKLDLLFASDRVGRQAGDQRDEVGEACGRRGGQGSSLQVEDLSQLQDIVSVAKRPAAIGGGGAIGLFHHPKQRSALK
ncbi:hypothetical protein [Sphingomonas sp. Root720]|uniref:hypothetical protein n=1 Tax=Sphingomonas sp. Root720 TaxID=1736595 RepID=UPI001F1EED0F|nr:hypothetical protein [Sphingomonas sp. Root720]